MSHVNALKCTNEFFDTYLPVHVTNSMALRSPLRPFTVESRNARRY